jgi:hypothetical protein
VLFMDMRKAYDSVPFHILIDKLLNRRFARPCTRSQM